MKPHTDNGAVDVATDAVGGDEGNNKMNKAYITLAVIVMCVSLFSTTEHLLNGGTNDRLKNLEGDHDALIKLSVQVELMRSDMTQQIGDMRSDIKDIKSGLGYSDRYRHSSSQAVPGDKDNR